MEAVAAEFSKADDTTKQLLTHSTAVWAGVPQDAEGGGDAADADNAQTSSTDAGGVDSSDAAINGTAVPAFASSLPPVAEQDEDETEAR